MSKVTGFLKPRIQPAASVEGSIVQGVAGGSPKPGVAGGVGAGFIPPRQPATTMQKSPNFLPVGYTPQAKSFLGTIPVTQVGMQKGIAGGYFGGPDNFFIQLPPGPVDPNALRHEQAHAVMDRGFTPYSYQQFGSGLGQYGPQYPGQQQLPQYGLGRDTAWLDYMQAVNPPPAPGMGYFPGMFGNPNQPLEGSLAGWGGPIEYYASEATNLGRIPPYLRPFYPQYGYGYNVPVGQQTSVAQQAPITQPELLQQLQAGTITVQQYFELARQYGLMP